MWYTKILNMIAVTICRAEPKMAQMYMTQLMELFEAHVAYRNHSNSSSPRQPEPLFLFGLIAELFLVAYHNKDQEEPPSLEVFSQLALGMLILCHKNATDFPCSLEEFSPLLEDS